MEVQTHMVDTGFHNKSLSPGAHKENPRQTNKSSQGLPSHKKPDIIYSQSDLTFTNAAKLNQETEVSCSNDKELNNNDQSENR